jgi:catechol 2,3-dioxygenase-like lactoylglutathione lyase family enzyme
MTNLEPTPRDPGVSPRCSGVQHVALRSADVARARAFYVDALGLPLLMESAEQFVVLAGETSVGVSAAPPGTIEAPAADASPIGVSHLSLSCESDRELARIAAALVAHGIASTGPDTDALFERRFVAFRDPDGVRWEVYVS